MVDQRRRCGPWRETWLGRVRRCNNPLWPEREELEIARPVLAQEPPEKPQPETTPALPERKTPPDCERRANTEHTNAVARKLIASVFGKGENGDEPD